MRGGASFQWPCKVLACAIMPVLSLIGWAWRGVAMGRLALLLAPTPVPGSPPPSVWVEPLFPWAQRNERGEDRLAALTNYVILVSVLWRFMAPWWLSRWHCLWASERMLSWVVDEIIRWPKSYLLFVSGLWWNVVVDDWNLDGNITW